MRDDPNIDTAKIVDTLEAEYGLRVATVRFLPIGYDLNAAVYEVVTEDGGRYFLKVRFGPVHEPSLVVPNALIDLGIGNVLGPVRTRSGALWRPLDGGSDSTVVLYPFILGESAMIARMTGDQWRTFGSTLRAVHDSGLGKRFREFLPVETFALPSAALVRRIMALTDRMASREGAAVSFADTWRVQLTRIREMLTRAEALGSSLRSCDFDLVLCHADIHAANILVGDEGGIHLIDWDGTMIAPRERDLLFVVGSRIARKVEPREEKWFFEGYGPIQIDPSALVYYRYERIIEDLGEIGRSVFLDSKMSEPARLGAVELAKGFFATGGAIDRAETVALSQ